MKAIAVIPARLASTRLQRKMLRQILKSLPADPGRLAAAAGIDPTQRAETISVSGFVAMARELTDIRRDRQTAR